MAKVRLKDGDKTPLPVLAYVLQSSLRLLHPIMPFVSEYIWQHLRDHVDGLEEALIIGAYPLGEGETDAVAEADAALLIDVVRAIRNIRAERGVDPGRTVEAYVACDGSSSVLEAGRPLVEVLARVRPLHVVASVGEAPADQVATAVLTHAQVVLPLAGLIDISAERDRTTKELQDAQAQVDRLSQKLSNAEFRSKAPPEVVAKQDEMLAAAKSRLAALEQRLSELG